MDSGIIAAGRFRARPTDGDWGFSNNGNEFVQVTFKILEGADEGKHVSWWGYFTKEGNSAKSVEALRYCGCTFPDDDITNLEGLGSEEVSIVIEHEEWDGKVRARVKWVNSLTGPTVTNQFSDNDRQSFKQRMKGLVVSQRNKPNSEDIPF